jgi:hypothetical protein
MRVVAISTIAVVLLITAVPSHGQLISTARFEPSVQVSPEWLPPTAIPDPVSTPGWQDSPRVSPDGKSLYFTYFRLDPILYIYAKIIRIAGPVRPGWPTQWPYSVFGALLYVSQFVNNAWQPPLPMPAAINHPEDQEGDEWVSADGNRILFTVADGDPARPKGIYYAERANGQWSPPVLANFKGFPFLSNDANPHLTLDEQTVFFQSSRPGGHGGDDIWMSRRISSVWQQPVCLGPGVNTNGPEGSPFSLDGKTLYFDDKGTSAIFRSTLGADGVWSRREVVVRGPVGDPSVTIAGDLYFVAAAVLRDSSWKITGYQTSVFVAKKKK